MQGAAMRCPESPPVAKRPAGPPPGPAAAAHSPLRAAPSPRRSAAAVPSRPSEPGVTRGCRRRRDLGHPARRPAKVRRRRRRRKAGGGAAYRRARGEAAAGPEPAPQGGEGAGDRREPLGAPCAPACHRSPAPSAGCTSHPWTSRPTPHLVLPALAKERRYLSALQGSPAAVVRLRSYRKGGNFSKVLKVLASWTSTQRANILSPYPILPTCQGDQYPFFPRSIS